MYYVYLVRCKDNSIYCGQTKNIVKRLREHNESKNKSAKYTKGRRPVVLEYVKKVRSLSNALKEECEIKRLSRQKKELLILKFKQMDKVISAK